MSYKKLQIWNLSREMVIEIHKMTISDLPKFELYETGSQIRRSIKSVKTNIVEGYGRRIYKQDYVHFLIIANSSLLETIDHLETLFETKSLTSKDKFEEILGKLILFGKKLHVFIETVSKHHQSKA